MDVPLYNTLAYFGSGYLISELCPACLTGISGCFFSLVFLFTCFSFFCSLWLAFQVLPGPCNLHRPGGIPRIALGKGGKKNPWELVPQGEYGGGWGLECGYEDDDQLESLGHHR